MGPEDILHSSGTVSQPGRQAEGLLQVARNFQLALWLRKLPGATFILGYELVLCIACEPSTSVLALLGGLSALPAHLWLEHHRATELPGVATSPSGREGLEDILHSGWGYVSASLSGHGQTRLLCCSVTKLCLTICDYMHCSMLGFPVLHCFLEFIQTQVHWVGDAIQPSHPLSPPSLPDLNLSQHQHLFQWVGPCFENSMNSMKRQARL